MNQENNNNAHLAESEETQKNRLHLLLEKELSSMPETNTNEQNQLYIAGFLGAFEKFGSVNENIINELYYLYVH